MIEFRYLGFGFRVYGLELGFDLRLGLGLGLGFWVILKIFGFKV